MKPAAFFLAAAMALIGVGQHPHNPKACPDKCNCSETGRCGCLPCPTEMSGGYAKRAVREGKRLVAFVGVKPRPVDGCLIYGTGLAEKDKPARYVVVFVPDGRGGGVRHDLPPGARDAEILAAGTPGVPPPLPPMPKTR